MQDYLVLNQCMLKNVRQQDLYKNNEVVGSKTVVDVCTWGEHVTVEVDPRNMEGLKTNLVGKATIAGALASRAQIKSGFDGKKDYAKNDVSFRFDTLQAFEVDKK